MDEILEGLQKYWNYRANSYSKSNIEELNNFKRDAWLKILLENAPKKEKLRVLDMGAGPGFFSILMSLAGHEVTAVDVTEEMLEKLEKGMISYRKILEELPDSLFLLFVQKVIVIHQVLQVLQIAEEFVCIYHVLIYIIEVADKQFSPKVEIIHRLLALCFFLEHFIKFAN